MTPEETAEFWRRLKDMTPEEVARFRENAKAAKAAARATHGDLFPATETGDAEAFAARHAALVRFDHLAKRWLIFRDHHWAEQTTGDVHRLALDTIRERQSAAIGDKDRFRWALQGEARRRQTNLLAIVNPRRTPSGHGRPKVYA